MPTDRPTEAPGSPIPGVIPEPVRLQHDPVPQPMRSNPGAEREARLQERAQRRGPAGKRPAARVPAPRRRSPRQAARATAAAVVGIVALAVVLGTLMGSLGAPGWLIGLAVSVVSLVLAAPLRRPRRR